MGKELVLGFQSSVDFNTAMPRCATAVCQEAKYVRFYEENPLFPASLNERSPLACLQSFYLPLLYYLFFHMTVHNSIINPIDGRVKVPTFPALRQGCYAGSRLTFFLHT